jgi:hypothetical protein
MTPAARAHLQLSAADTLPRAFGIPLSTWAVCEALRTDWPSPAVVIACTPARLRKSFRRAASTLKFLPRCRDRRPQWNLKKYRYDEQFLTLRSLGIRHAR